MIFSKKTNYVLLASLLLLNIVFRIPWTPRGVDIVDSAFIWSLANSISDSGYIKWALHPTSLFGLYPLSYPSGSPVILSIISQLTGIGVEHIILAFGFFLAALGMLGSYVMAMKLRKDHLFAFLTSFAFSTAPVFIEYTRWTATTRNLFIALFPLLLWAVFWSNKKDNFINRQLLLIVIFVVILGTVHRLSFLLILIFTSYILTMIVWHVKDNVYFSIFCARLFWNQRFLALVLLWILAFSLQFSDIKFYSDIWYNYQTGAFAEGTDVYILLLNLSTNYIGNIGLLMPFGLIGLILLFIKVDKDFNNIFIIIICILTSTILALGYYVPQFLLPFASILIALSICKLLEFPKRVDKHQSLIKKQLYEVLTLSKKAPAIIIAVCLVTSISFSCFMVHRHMCVPIEVYGDVTWMTDEIPAAGFFLKKNGEATFVSNDGTLLNRRIYASTGIPAINSDAVVQLIAGWIRKEEVKVRPISWSSLSTNSDNIYSLIETPSIYKKIRLLDCNSYQNDNFRQICDAYGINLLVINNIKYELTCKKAPINFGHRIYDNGKQSIWPLHLRNPELKDSRLSASSYPPYE